mmetsp:Transcript_980/g.1393  ORF Transcript_980/g.1393 Transcript_980/m.1393 type:complete len:593 (+) Transcript_980:52-1830(+)
MKQWVHRGFRRARRSRLIVLKSWRRCIGNDVGMDVAKAAGSCRKGSGAFVNDTKTRSGRSSRRYWLLGGLAIAGGTIFYRFKKALNSENGADVFALTEHKHGDQVVVMKKPQAFVHPFENKSWAYKTYIRTKRTIFLAVLFAPCAMLYGLSELMASDGWREFWLDMLVQTVELSGCSVQKFAQWCSMRPDMFPADIVAALSKLRCDAPPHSYEHTRKVFYESFGREIEEIFETFEEKPVASGTVAQVHRARLRKEHAIGGRVRDVAVKIRHPSVMEETFCDVDLLFEFIEMMSSKLTMPMRKEDFVRVLQRQTNFEWEAYNLQLFARNFNRETLGEWRSKSPKSSLAQTVKFPDVSLDLLSPSVLVESWANGDNLGSFIQNIEDGISDVKKEIMQSASKLGKSVSVAFEETKKDLARTVFAMNMKMFLRDNLIHSDMHAGNLLFSAKTGNLTVLDAGQTASLLPDVAPSFGRFLHAICKRDPEGVYKYLLEFDVKKGIEVNREDFRSDVRDAMDLHCGNGKMVVVGDVMGELFHTLNHHKMTLRSDVSVSLMSMAVSEGLIRQLDPEFDMVAAAAPYIAKYGIGYISRSELS